MDVICRTCFRSHPPEEYRCAACSTMFRCPSQTVPYEVGSGKTFRAHIRVSYGRGGPDTDVSEPCGPVVRVISRAEERMLASAGARLIG